MHKKTIGLAMLVAGLALTPAAGSWNAAEAQAYPTKPVRLVVPFAPGGRVEGIARLLAQSLTEQLGQPFVVESRAGAGGSVGSDFVAKAAGDGYTLLLASAGTHAILPNVDKKLPYDPVKNFTPIANLVEGFTFIGAHPSVPANSIAELVRLAKEKPGTINFATSGVGTYGHFAGELFKISAGINLVHVPYRGSGPALNDLTAGHVQLMVAGELVELAKAGKIRVLATTNERRWHELPDVPSLKELGFPQFTVHSWIALLGPSGIPAPVVAQLNAAAGKMLADAKALEQLKVLGVLPVFSTPEGLGKQIEADRDAYAKVAATAGLKFD
jgi:tripartite-type tricarboxylate transporter receptor subunit TctC